MKQLIYFSAAHCAPCRTFKPIMNSLNGECKIKFVDTSNDPQLTAQYNVRSIPTTILTINGVEVQRFIGVKSRNEVLSFYNSY